MDNSGMDQEILTEDELKRAVQKIFRLSQTDAKFRELCLSDPNEAIRRITGKTVARDVKIQFRDSAPDEASTPRDAAK